MSSERILIYIGSNWPGEHCFVYENLREIEFFVYLELTIEKKKVIKIYVEQPICFNSLKERVAH